MVFDLEAHPITLKLRSLKVTDRQLHAMAFWRTQGSSFNMWPVTFSPDLPADAINWVKPFCTLKLLGSEGSGPREAWSYLAEEVEMLTREIVRERPIDILEAYARQQRADQARRAAKLKKPNVLQEIITGIVQEEPNISCDNLKKKLSAQVHGPAIETVTEDVIEYNDHGQRARSASTSGLKHRLTRARKKVRNLQVSRRRRDAK